VIRIDSLQHKHTLGFVTRLQIYLVLSFFLCFSFCSESQSFLLFL